ncbi:hypothetical protein BD414DRAFT_501984 [Trametes punicea]|nr:hypothetical protein BD414DRAFT_501984 [Trametes punicea]
MLQSFSRFLLLAFLVVHIVFAVGVTEPNPASGAPSRVRRDFVDGEGFNPSGIVLRPLSLATLDPARSLTNAQRLARGLPPRPRQSATPCALSQPTGLVRITSESNTLSGYISATPNNYGQFTLTSSVSQALQVVLLRCNSDSEPFGIQTLNGLAVYPYLGAVVGSVDLNDNLLVGSSNYAPLM